MASPEKLITLGDSHALHGWETLSLRDWEIEIHHLGARLMHTFARTQLVTSLPPHDAICFCFGEIDCRVHAKTHGLKDLARDYCERILSYIPKNPIVMGVVPPQKAPRPVHRGTAEERLLFVRQLNLDLQDYAKYYTIRYLDVYNPYADQEGFMREDLVGERGHIGKNWPLEIEIRRILEQIKTDAV